MNTTISISKETRAALQEVGKMSENYDDVIQRILFERRVSILAKEFFDKQSWSTLDEAIEWTKLKIKNDQNKSS